jgi:hypothetical protein
MSRVPENAPASHPIPNGCGETKTESMLSWLYITGGEMRTLVDIPAEDLKLLNGVVKTLAISRAEFVRRAIAKSLEPHRLSQEQAAFGLWARRRVDGLKYQERMREEWQEGTSSSTPTS